MTGQGNAAGTVHTMYPAGQKEPIFYASMARDSEACRERLVATLWEAFSAQENPGSQPSPGAPLPLQAVAGPLGRPQLLVGGIPGPGVSFSEGGGKVWAALCEARSEVGIDVAGAGEFTGDYPVHRVFLPEELQHALKLTGGDPAAACALLWSVKEAFVKALGCAFHHLEPRQVRVYPPAAQTEDGYDFPVALSPESPPQWNPSSSRPSSVRARPLGQMWLSIAQLNRRPTAHE
jgi:phosphopantetheinyl transferase